MAPHSVLLLALLNLRAQMLDLELLLSDGVVHLLVSEVLLVARHVSALEHLDLLDVDLDLLTQMMLLDGLLVDLAEQLNVVVHDLLLVLLVQLLLLVHVLVKRGHVLLEVATSVLVRVLIVGTALLVLEFLGDVLLVEVDDGRLQLLLVESVLQGLVNVVLEHLLVVLLLVQSLLERLQLLGKTLLTHAQILNNKSQMQVDATEVLHLLLELIRLLLQQLDASLTRTNFTLQLLDLVVEHELELLELLSLLAKLVDLLVLVLNGAVTLTQLNLLRLDLLLQVVRVSDQLVQVVLLRVDIVLLADAVLLALSVLVVTQRQLSLGLHTLIDDLTELLLVLILEHVNLVPGLVLDSLTLSLVCVDHASDLLVELGSHFLLAVGLHALVLLELLNDLLVIQSQLIETLFEATSVGVTLVLQLVKARLISRLLLIVVKTSTFLLDGVSLLHLLNALIHLALLLFLLLLKVKVALIRILFFLILLSLVHCDLLLLLLNVLLRDVLTLLSLDGDLLSEVVNLLLQLGAVLLRDEDLVGRMNLDALLAILLGVLIVHLEDTDDVVLTSGEHVAVVGSNSHSLERRRVCLHFRNLGEGKVNDLNGSRLATFGDTSEHGATTVQNADLRNVETDLVRQRQLALLNHLDAFVHTGRVHNIFRVRLVDDGRELIALVVVALSRIGVVRVAGILIKVPVVNITIPATRQEARVIIEPMNATHGTEVTLVAELRRVLTRVEFVDIDLVEVSDGEHVTTVRELDLSARLDVDRGVFLQLVLHDVQHSDTVSETNDQMEAGRVESDRVRLILVHLTDEQLGGRRGIVVPNTHGAISRSGGNPLLLEANIHARNSAPMEGANEVLILGIFLGTLKTRRQLHNLVVVRREHNAVIGTGQSETHDPALQDARVQLRIFVGQVLRLRELVVALVRVLGLLTSLVHEDRAVVTSNDEASLVRLDALNVEAFTRTVLQRELVVAGLEQQDLTLIGTNEALAIRKPQMASVVVRDLRLLLGHGTVDRLHLVLLNLEELVTVVARDEDRVLVSQMETDLHAERVTVDAGHALVNEELLLVPDPHDDLNVGLGSERYQE